ncbi:TonB family protein [Bradyrhizobium sp. LA6.1]|uniref:energy transducer TonB family protein n=1 Tax=Bradyrhizobium sp. LA6.1 TaxID=3156378 RepID=UPI003396C94D
MQMKFPLLAAALLGLLLAVPTSSYADKPATKAWIQRLAAHIESNKVFPPEATGQTGEAKVRVAIDRSGKLISRVLIESTGSPPLDAAALAIVERAAPFPEPPPEVKEDMLGFIVPIVFRGYPQPSPENEKRLQSWIEDQAKENAKAPRSDKDDARLNSTLRSICRGC